MDGKRAEETFMNNLAVETLRNEYMEKAQDIGSNAINLVRDYFDYRVTDFVDGKPVDWTLTDLDMALDEMGGNKRSIDEVEIKTVDNRDKYTKALARCAIHDPDKYALLAKRMESCDDETIGKLILRKIEVNEVLLDHHAEFFWDGIL